MVPFRVGFDRKATGLYYLFDVLGDFLFAIDIGLTFRTGMRDNMLGKIQYNQRKIARDYLRSPWFFIDVLSTFPFEEVALAFTDGKDSVSSAAFTTASFLRISKILRLFKLLRLRKLGIMMEKANDKSWINQNVLSLFKTLAMVVFISHLMACIWYYSTTADPLNSWAAPFMTSSTLEEDELATLQYLVALYWSFTTMTTVGYGDVIATNNTERIVSMVVMIISVSVFGYVIGNIATLLENMDASKHMRSTRTTTLHEYCMTRNLPTSIVTEMKDHFEYYYSKRSPFDEKKILNTLPNNLRLQVVRILKFYCFVEVFILKHI